MITDRRLAHAPKGVTSRQQWASYIAKLSDDIDRMDPLSDDTYTQSCKLCATRHYHEAALQEPVTPLSNALAFVTRREWAEYICKIAQDLSLMDMDKGGDVQAQYYALEAELHYYCEVTPCDSCGDNGCPGCGPIFPPIKRELCDYCRSWSCGGDCMGSDNF